MSQKISPFIEGKFGWDFGESGWNLGMDENLLKLFFICEGKVDAVVNSLPTTAENGKAYFLTTDKRLYFVVAGSWYSVPMPLWGKLSLRSTGEILRFDGTSLISIPDTVQTRADLDGVVSTLNTLGSAALANTTDFATPQQVTDATTEQKQYTDQKVAASGDIKSFDSYESVRVYAGSLDTLFIKGRKTPNDGGEGFWSVLRAGTKPREDGGTIIHLHNGWWVERLFNGDVDPLWFGATRSTASPFSTGDDISTALWNAWPPFITGEGFLNQPGHDWGDATFLANNRPFSNTDTWDRIALQLAAWSLNPIKLQDGDYYLNAALRWTDRMYNSLTGSGMYNSRIRFVDGGTHTRIGRIIPLIEVYRVAGPPLTFSDTGFIGVTGHVPQLNPETATDESLACLYLLNCNGVHIDRNWVAGGSDFGILVDALSSDCFIDGNTFEYCGISVAAGSGCELTIANNNLWQSYTYQYACSGVVGFGDTAGHLLLTDNKFIGYSGRIVDSGPHRATWQGGRAAAVQGTGGALPYLSVKIPTAGSSIHGVNFDLGAGASDALFRLGSKVVFSSNVIRGEGFTHTLLNVGAGTVDSASYTSVTGNLFDVTGTIAEGGMLFTSAVDGSAYSGACQKCIFTGNIIPNHSASTLGWDTAKNLIANNQWS